MPDPADHPLYRSAASPPPASPPPRRRLPAAALPRLTYALMAINGAIFLVAMLLPELEWELFLRGALIPQQVVQGREIYRLLTAMFLHGSVAHIFFNLMGLYVMGRALEPIFGARRFLLVYLLGGLTGSACSLALSAMGSASVGASGAVFALFAAQALHLAQHRHIYRNVRAQLREMAFILGMNLLIGVLPGSRIDNWAHIGGILGGTLLTWMLGPRLQLTGPVRNLQDLARMDRNPLSGRLPQLALYCGVWLLGVVAVVFLRA